MLRVTPYLLDFFHCEANQGTMLSNEFSCMIGPIGQYLGYMKHQHLIYHSREIPIFILYRYPHESQRSDALQTIMDRH